VLLRAALALLNFSAIVGLNFVMWRNNFWRENRWTRKPKS